MLALPAVTLAPVGPVTMIVPLRSGSAKPSDTFLSDVLAMLPSMGLLGSSPA